MWFNVTFNNEQIARTHNLILYLFIWTNNVHYTYICTHSCCCWIADFAETNSAFAFPSGHVKWKWFLLTFWQESAFYGLAAKLLEFNHKLRANERVLLIYRFVWIKLWQQSMIGNSAPKDTHTLTHAPKHYVCRNSTVCWNWWYNTTSALFSPNNDWFTFAMFLHMMSSYETLE